MKFLNVPVSVEARKGVPCRIRWGRRTYTVRRLLDFWILQSRWWATEEKRVYFRLETDRGVVEVFRSGERERGGLAERGDLAKRAGRGARETTPPGKTLPPGKTPPPGKPPPPGRTPPGKPLPRKPPPFVEGDTHTRELRQTESPYRPDAAALAGRRLKDAAPTADAPPPSPSPWVLSKVID